MKPALLIIDMQNDFVLPGAPAVVDGAYGSVPRVQDVLAHFRQAGLPVVHVVRAYAADGSDIEITRRDGFLAGPKYAVPGTEGVRIVEALTPIDGEHVIVKRRFSAFFATGLEETLRSIDVDRLVICGTQYPNCIRSTAFDAISHDFPTTVITDATSATDAQVAQASIRDMQGIGIRCMPFEAWLART